MLKETCLLLPGRVCSASSDTLPSFRLQALVRAAAWRALVSILELLPPELRRSRALQLLLQQCRETDHHVEVHRALTAGFGALLLRLVPDMDGDADVSACLACYRSLAWQHDHATRLACAASLAAVVRAASPRRYGSHLHDTLVRLGADADWEVRLAVAQALPDVAAVLGRDRCGQYLRQPLVALLQDERQDVQAALLARLPELLAHFAPPHIHVPASSAAAAAAAAAAAEEQRGKAFGAFVEPLLRLEASSKHNWRLQLALLQAMASFPALFPPDTVYDRFLPLAHKYMESGAAALRGAAAAAAAACWRALRRPNHRTALYGRIIHGFAQVCVCVQGVGIWMRVGAAVECLQGAGVVRVPAHLLISCLPLALAYSPSASATAWHLWTFAPWRSSTSAASSSK